MIVITTPTGQIGRQTLDILLDRGFDRTGEIRVIARDPARLPQRVRERVEVIRGSHGDPAVLADAFTGADTVFWLVPPNQRATDLDGYYLGFTRTACTAVVERGVRRVVGVSTLGRGLAKNAGQVSSALAADELMESTGVAYRALCMPGFMENLLTQIEPIRRQGTFFLSIDGDCRRPTCATRDIAAVAAGLLLDDAWTGQADVPVPGPEDLSVNEMAAIMSEVLSRAVRYQRLPAEDYKRVLTGHGLSDEWAQGLVDMAAEVERGIYDLPATTPRAATSTTFRQWCTDTLKPAVESLP